MGKLLNIRVMAQTYNEEDVAKAWPRLCALAWPQWSTKLGLKDLGIKTSVSVESSLGARPHGVVELASALPDLLKFGDLPKNVAEVLQAPVKEVAGINHALAVALGDWRTKEALELATALEEALDKAEQSITKNL